MKDKPKFADANWRAEQCAKLLGELLHIVDRSLLPRALVQLTLRRLFVEAYREEDEVEDFQISLHTLEELMADLNKTKAPKLIPHPLSDN